MTCPMSGFLVLIGHGSHSVLEDKATEPSTGERGDTDNTQTTQQAVKAYFLAAKCSAAGCRFTTGNTSKLLGYCCDRDGGGLFS